MAAPANNKCEKCFEPLPPGAVTCPECGAPVKDATQADAEAAVYPELAKANLARMRGDYKQAEDQLLAILKRYPNNPSANEMLGDLAAERDDWQHAVQWYELALEIVPTSASIARKIKDARAKTQQKDAQVTTTQLGLPDPTSRTPLLVAAGIILLLAAFAGVYYLGTRQRPAAYYTPPQIIKAQPSTTGGQKSSNPGEPEPASNDSAPPMAMTTEEQSIFDTLKSRAEDGHAVMAVSSDPRAGNLRITFDASGGDPRTIAARLARDAFANESAFHTITLRGVSNGAVSYMADSDRGRMIESQDPTWQQSQTSADAWVSYVLSNEWPKGATPPTSGGEATTTPPSAPSNSTGGAPPGGQ